MKTIELGNRVKITETHEVLGTKLIKGDTYIVESLKEFPEGLVVGLKIKGEMVLTIAERIELA